MNVVWITHLPEMFLRRNAASRTDLPISGWPQEARKGAKRILVELDSPSRVRVSTGSRFVSWATLIEAWSSFLTLDFSLRQPGKAVLRGVVRNVASFRRH